MSQIKKEEKEKREDTFVSEQTHLLLEKSSLLSAPPPRVLMETVIEEKEEEGEEENVIDPFASTEGSLPYLTALPENVYTCCFSDEIKNLQNVTRMRRDLLVYKAQRVTWINNLLQISTIVASSFVTFLETLRASLGISIGFADQAIPIVLSTYIGLSVSIFKFFKMDEHRESINQLILEMTGLLKRFSAIRSQIQDLKRSDGKGRLPDQDAIPLVMERIRDNFRQETYVNYLEAQEKFDVLMPYPELIRYKKLFAVKMLKHRIVQANILKVQAYDHFATEERNRSPSEENSARTENVQKRSFVKRVTACQKFFRLLSSAFWKKNIVEIDFEAFESSPI
jgi:hypothetical protein